MKKIYKLLGITGKSPLVVDFIKSSNNIFDYFMIDDKDARLPKIIIASIQYEKDIERIKKRDVIDASIGLIIVSEKFIEIADEKFYREAKPVNCYLHYDSIFLKNYYALDIKKKLRLVDKKRSSFSDKNKKYIRNVVCKSKIDDDFLIAKDIDYPTVFRISESFAEKISHLRLNIKKG